MTNIYQKLSDEVLESIPTGEVGDIKQLIESRLPRSDKPEVTGEFKKTLVLAAQKSKLKVRRTQRKSKEVLSARERRDLGLYRLPKKGLQYSAYIPLHELWKVS